MVVSGPPELPSYVYSHHLEYEELGDQFSHNTLRNHYENIHSEKEPRGLT